mgnify:CR=1 FL=1
MGFGAKKREVDAAHVMIPLGGGNVGCLEMVDLDRLGPSEVVGVVRGDVKVQPGVCEEPEGHVLPPRQPEGHLPGHPAEPLTRTAQGQACDSQTTLEDAVTVDWRIEERVMVLHNPSVEGSASVASHYAEFRGIPDENHCAIATEADLGPLGEAFKRINNILQKVIDDTHSTEVQEYMAKRMTKLELEQHRRQGHPHFRAECPECRSGALRSRAHRRRVETDRPGGELSLDISGPHLPGRWPSDTPESWGKRAQYFLIAAYCGFSPVENAKRQSDEAFAEGMVNRIAPGGEPAGRLANAPEGR